VSQSPNPPAHTEAGITTHSTPTQSHFGSAFDGNLREEVSFDAGSAMILNETNRKSGRNQRNEKNEQNGSNFPLFPPQPPKKINFDALLPGVMPSDREGLEFFANFLLEMKRKQLDEETRVEWRENCGVVDVGVDVGVGHVSLSSPPHLPPGQNGQNLPSATGITAQALPCNGQNDQNQPGNGQNSITSRNNQALTPPLPPLSPPPTPYTISLASPNHTHPPLHVSNSSTRGDHY
jgi:hypothetical protein